VHRNRMDGRVTVITTVYNGANFIERTFNSVIHQSYKNFEYVIVDDGSTDSSLEVISRLIVEHPDELIHLISQSNSGEAAAINVALKQSSGDFVCVVSADDPLLDQHLEKMVCALKRNPLAVVAYPDWVMIDENDEQIRLVQTLEYDIRTLVGDFVCLPGPGALIRRSAISGSNLRNSKYKYVSDYAAWLELSLLGPFIRVPEVLAAYRIHRGQATVVGRGRLMSDEIEGVIDDFFRRDDLPHSVRRLKRRSRAFASYYAGLQKLHDPAVSGRRRMCRSLFLAPPFPLRRQSHRRNPLAVAAVLMVPWTNRLFQYRQRPKML
jgi:glycosyltransferase involved in cell wall biosynthesis